MRAQADVIVAGGGPAGATAAYWLARAGASVLLLEKEALPRYKTCGGGLTPKTLRLLDFDIAPVLEQVVTRVAISERMGRIFTHDYRRPICYMVMRDRFDQFLVERAREAGARVMEGCAVKDVLPGEGGVEVATRDGPTFSARVLVGADGANSVVARSLGLMQNVPVSIGLETELRAAESDLVRRADTVLLDLASIPDGYGWIFPKQDHLSIGVGGLAANADRLRRYARQFDAFCRSSLGQAEVVQTRGHRLPYRPAGRPIQGPRTVLLGDAAGLVNRLDGEGIFYAIWSARIAAPVILQALAESGSPDLSGYERAIDAEMMPELRHAAQLMRLYSVAPWLFVTVLERVGPAWGLLEGALVKDRGYTEIVRALGPARLLVERLA